MVLILRTLSDDGIKVYVECRFLFSAHRLMMAYICTKFLENILNGIRFMEGHEKLTDGQTDKRKDGQTDGRRARQNTT